MNRILLQDMLDDIPFESLSPAWTTKVRIRLFLHTDDANRAPQEYQEYWFDHPAQSLEPALR